MTTPQEVALADCRKCLDFCRRLEIPVTGIVENMSGFVCPDCSARHELFGTGGGARLAEKEGIPLLARVPLDPAFLKDCDFGELPAGLERSATVRAELEKVIQAIR
ncbi:Iron-sulfur cluster carrier protein [bioreactor metagenome]|uniref:Iron-sulfur cluster carrier protein n=1 Tax=bioreactor metagenome TaxID=1076179 RepID=A0A645JX11_9ZZZZ